MIKPYKNLIYYASFTGNTDKVAHAIADVFDEQGWQNDIVLVDQSFNPKQPGVDFLGYDFICAGSPVFWHVPYDPLLWGIRQLSHRVEYVKMETGPKLGLAFATYAGAHFGEHEADAALILLELAYEHLGYKSIGKIAVPGKVHHRPMTDWYFEDMHLRPHDQDLKNVKSFVGNILQSPLFKETYPDRRSLAAA